MDTRDKNSHTKKISPDQARALKAALASYYKGERSLTEALDIEEGTSTSTYYRLKDEHPSQMEQIDRSARREALLDKAGLQLHIEGAMMTESLAAQREAAMALLQTIPHLLEIATGRSREVEVTGRDGESYTKMIASYPRDMVAAAKLLQEIARGGTLPELPTNFSAADEKDDRAPDPSTLLGPGPDFSRIEITTPDGRRLTATVERDDEIIEGEVKDDVSEQES